MWYNTYGTFYTYPLLFSFPHEAVTGLPAFTAASQVVLVFEEYEYDLPGLVLYQV